MKSWLSSPLAINYLLSVCKNGPSYEKKYVQIYKDLKNKQGYVTSNQLFISPSFNSEKAYETSDVGVKNIEFQQKDAVQCIMEWVNKYGSINEVDIAKHILPTATSLLCNISIFKGVWQTCHQTNPVMTVHNSFSYTEDIKYEARLIELPMQDADIKLVIVVPNEVASIGELFNKLVEGGLPAAVSCVRPLFTFSTVFEAPSIEFSSQDNLHFSKNKCDDLNGAQIGNVQINENGTNISLLTLLSSKHKDSTETIDEGQSEKESPFYFSVLYKDTAVFTGRYVKRVT